MADPEHPDLPEDPDGSEPAAVHRFVDRLGGALASSGMALQPSRAFAALLATESGRLTAAELADVLEISPSAVSGAVGALEQLGWIRRERPRGSRRDVYIVAEDAWHDVMLRTDQIYAPITAALAEGVGSIDGRPQARARIALSLEFLRFVSGEMAGIVERWERHRATVVEGDPPAATA